MHCPDVPLLLFSMQIFNNVGAKCGLTVDSGNYPINRLYYEMQDIFYEYRKKKDYYESPSMSKGAEDELSR